jgi:hypothetical protein
LALFGQAYLLLRFSARPKVVTLFIIRAAKSRRRIEVTKSRKLSL